VIPVGPDRSANLSAVEDAIKSSALRHADLVLFPEAALTGLVNDDCPEHDLPLGESIPGATIDRIARCIEQARVWCGIGLLERDGTRLYDSALLFTPEGRIALHYRRITPGWHGNDANPASYASGDTIPTTTTPWGRVAFLLCGDLFDDRLIDQARALELDLLLVPFARCFSGGGVDQRRWDTEELPTYCEQVRRAHVTTLLVNYLTLPDLVDDGSFGGAFAISPTGVVIGALPLGQPGSLIVELA